jgi:hypothetical protein
MNFLGFIMPLPYMLVYYFVSVNGNRAGFTNQFSFRLTMDVFSNSGGVHAAVWTLAYLRPYIFKFVWN